MISYIFKSKIKNILVSIFSIIIICIKLDELHKYILLQAWDYIILKFIGLVPFILIFLYMVTLKRDYKIKQFLFPISFAIFTLTTIFSITNCFDEYTFASINGLIRLFISLIIKIVLITGYTFCFVGTLSNFKRINFLRLGLPICIITIFIQRVSYNHLVNWIGNMFFSTLYYLNESFRASILLLFYISIFILTLTKKSEYIDITPFVEERKIKKATKKAKRLANENPEESSPLLVPEGSWRCMGCGEILPDDKNECECGYKR
ncbi:MAG: hypothetical protein E7548_02275 [Ruminococcaceae bacterium]|nr:hypothetical protein [Oscillospiraceae bacterium]